MNMVHRILAFGPGCRNQSLSRLLCHATIAFLLCIMHHNGNVILPLLLSILQRQRYSFSGGTHCQPAARINSIFLWKYEACTCCRKGSSTNSNASQIHGFVAVLRGSCLAQTCSTKSRCVQSRSSIDVILAAKCLCANVRIAIVMG